MRFRLTYDGSLKAASQTNTRSAEKWAIRKALDPQLAEFWAIHPALLGNQLGYPAKRDPDNPGQFLPFGAEQVREQLRRPVTIGGHPFLPLVRKSLNLTCAVDILFLRKGEAGSVVTHGGDLDNRIKVLFDGLRLPSEHEVSIAGTLTQTPFHCLLEDDRLISSMAVRTDRLLTRPDASFDEVRLIIDLIVSPNIVRIENSGFLGD